MKKLIVSGVLLIASSLPFAALASSPYGHCDTHASNNQFCHCFLSSCEKVFGSGQCQYGHLVGYFNKVGAQGACSAYAPGADRQECIDGINHFIQACG